MVRTILFILISLVLVTFLRMVVGMILNTMKGMMNEAGSPSTAGGGHSPSPSTPPVSGELKRDPVCGTFVPTSTAFQKTVKGEAYHFCSAACRDKYGA